MLKKLFSLDTTKDFTNHYYRHTITGVTYNIEEDREDDPKEVTLILYYMAYGKWQEVFRVIYPLPFKFSEEIAIDLLSKAHIILDCWSEYKE